MSLVKWQKSVKLWEKGIVNVSQMYTEVYLQKGDIDWLIDRGYGSFWQASKGSVIRKSQDQHISYIYKFDCW